MSIVVARYLADGRLDVTFANAGILRADIAGGPDQVHALAVDALGRIMVLGGVSHLKILRLLDQGGLDLAFGQEGRVSRPFLEDLPSSTILDAAFDRRDQLVATTSRGAASTSAPGALRIVAAGHTFTDSTIESQAFAIARYSLSGEVDGSFGEGGRTVTVFPSGRSTVHALSIAADGRIVGAGSLASPGTFVSIHVDMAVARYLADGSIDSGFGDNGRVITALPSGSAAADAAITTGDGRIIGGGWIVRDLIPLKLEIPAVRYLSNGDLDDSFGKNGITRTEFVNGNSRLRALAFDGHDRIIGAGSAGERMALIRYLDSGDLDPAFGGDGRVTIAFQQGPSQAFALMHHVRTEQTIVVGQAENHFAVARIDDNGQRDLTFGDAGRIRTVIGSVGEVSAAQSVLVDDRERIIVAGVVVRTGDGPDLDSALPWPPTGYGTAV